MSRAIDGLLGRIPDANLRAELAREVEVLRANKDFGLVFERHLPENVRLYGQTIRRGSTVQKLANIAGEVWVVRKIDAEVATLIDEEGGEVSKPLSELVVVSEFGEPIYPGFEVVDSLERGGDKPFHTVINGENFHVLEALAYVYEGQVDCIYIDPPYNTGARDWKYNNDYVDGEDAYRHSKWLSFMEKRLKIAKKLLNPDNSVLIVTIDEKEVHRLGLLLEDLFSNSVRQMVTIVISPLGQARKQELARVEEYAFFVFLGTAGPSSVPDDLLTTTAPSKRSNKVRWEWLIRGGTHSLRRERPNLFYPVFVDPTARKIDSAGDPLPSTADRLQVDVPDGLVAVWPLNTNGNEGNWRCSAEYLRELVAQGYAKLGAYDRKLDRYSLLYLGKAQIHRIESGELVVVGRDAHNVAEVESREDQQKLVTAKTVWSRLTHRAGEYGSSLLKRFVPSSDFPFPKSIYAVKDTLQVATASHPEALIVDFFAGSGTTAHAAMLLNREDGGRRRTISVTNNEVSEEDADRLSKAGHQPGDPKWESQGIFEHVTKPRVTAAITGKTHGGGDVEGDYKGNDEFPMSEGFDENAIFLKLTYLEKNNVARGKAFEAVAPLLWLKAGAKGPQITKVKKPFAAPKGASYAVLFDTAKAAGFIEALRERDEIEHAYIVTNSMAEYQQVISELPTTVETTMLYEDYISNFELNLGRLL